MSSFNGVEDTLFIPLAGRVEASKKFKEFFYDSKALELEKYIPSSSVSENTSEYFTIAAIARFYEFDRLVKEFIEKNKECNVLCLGCGLETMYYRINDKRAHFFEVDFPDVIKQRRLVLGENENETLIGSNLLDFRWMDLIDKERPTIAIASGVFQYLHSDEVKSLILELKQSFNNFELLFDATNKKGIEEAVKYVRKTGNESAMMYFYVESPKKFATSVDCELIKKIPFYRNCTRILKKKLSFGTKFMCFFGDRLGFTKIIHLKIS